MEAVIATAGRSEAEQPAPSLPEPETDAAAATAAAREALDPNQQTVTVVDYPLQPAMLEPPPGFATAHRPGDAVVYHDPGHLGSPPHARHGHRGTVTGVRLTRLGNAVYTVQYEDGTVDDGVGEALLDPLAPTPDDRAQPPPLGATGQQPPVAPETHPAPSEPVSSPPPVETSAAAVPEPQPTPEELAEQRQAERTEEFRAVVDDEPLSRDQVTGLDDEGAVNARDDYAKPPSFLQETEGARPDESVAPEVAREQAQAARTEELRSVVGEEPAAADQDVVSIAGRRPPLTVRHNMMNGRRAVNQVLQTRQSVPNAMWRDDIGWITIDYGVPGDPNRDFKGGYGLSHIIAKRTAQGLDGEAWARVAVPEILARGRLQRLSRAPNSRRADIVLGDNQVAVVSLYRDYRRESWLVTSYLEGETDPGGEGAVSGRDTYAPEPPFARATEGAGSTGNVSPAETERNQGEDGILEAPRGGPRTGRDLRATAEPAAGRAEDITGVRELLGQLRDLFGIPVREGRLRNPRAAGQYDTRQAVIRQRELGDIEVLAHEIGHHMEQHYGQPLRVIMRRHRGELEPLDYHQGRADRTLAMREGFAEFVSIYTLNRSYVANQAPRFLAVFEQFLADTDPATLAALRQIHDAYRVYLTAPSQAATRSSVVTSPSTGPMTRLRQWFSGQRLRDGLSAFFRQGYTARVDRTHPINVAVRRLQQVYAKNHGQRLAMEYADDPQVLARLSVDSGNAGYVDLIHGVVNYETGSPDGPGLSAALERAFGDRGWTEETFADFGTYLYNRRAIHLWNQFDAGDRPRPPTREPKVDHEQSITELERDNPGFAEAAGMVYDWTNRLWKKRLDAGLITQEQYDEGLQTPDYVPFFRDRTDVEPGGGIGIQGGTGKRPAMRRLRGSLRAVINPIESLMREAYIVERHIANNEVKKALYRLSLRAGPGSGAVVERIPDKEVRGFTASIEEVMQEIARVTGIEADAEGGRDAQALAAVATMFDSLDVDGLRFFRAGDISERGEPIVYAWVNGERQAMRLADGEFGRELYEALTQLNKETSSFAVDVMAGVATTLRVGVTTDPAFWLANLIRDQASAWILAPNYRPGIDLARGTRSTFTDDDLRQQYTAAGGLIGDEVLAAFKGRADTDIRRLRRTGINVRRIATPRALVRATGWSETATRLGVFTRAKEVAQRRGLSDKQAIIEAAYLARDYIDFGRNGSRMLAIRRVVTFMNAALQGLDKSARVLGGQGLPLRTVLTPWAKTVNGMALTPVERRRLRQSRSAWAKVMFLGMIGAALTWLYRDDEEYQEVSEYLRARHWMVRFGGEWIAIPKPFELAIFSNIFERSIEYGHNEDATAIDRMRRGLVDMILPPYMPVMFAPMIEQWGNKDLFTGRPLISDHLLGRPPEAQYHSYTSSLARWIGEQMRVSPIVVENYITSWGGSWARNFLTWSTEADPGAPTPGLEDTFVARRFIRDWTRGAMSTDRFFDNMSDNGGRLEAARSLFRDLMQQGRLAEAAEYAGTLDPDQLAYALWRYHAPGNRVGQYTRNRMHPMYRANEARRAIFGVRETVRESTDLTPDQKAAIDDLLAERLVAEVRNGMIAIGVEGYAVNRDMMDLDANLRSIDVISPETARAIVEQMADLPPADTAYRFYPQIQSFADQALQQLRAQAGADREDQ